MTESKTKPIVNLADLALSAFPPHLQPSGAAAETFQPRMAWIGQTLGAQKLGYNVTVLAPGKKAFPAHNHHVNEEMFLVLVGSGHIRIGAETYPIREGDVIACPAGGPETAHQIENTGAVELRYLAVSTKESPEIVEYPDSGKFAVLSTQSPGRTGPFRYVGKEEDNRDYWEGE